MFNSFCNHYYIIKNYELTFLMCSTFKNVLNFHLKGAHNRRCFLMKLAMPTITVDWATRRAPRHCKECDIVVPIMAQLRCSCSKKHCFTVFETLITLKLPQASICLKTFVVSRVPDQRLYYLSTTPFSLDSQRYAFRKGIWWHKLKKRCAHENT